MKVGIVAQRDNVRAANLAEELALGLQYDDIEVALDEATAAAISTEGVAPATMGDVDLVVSIGGDGTFLYVAREVGKVPIMGVNLGEVGFLNAVSPEEADEVIGTEIDRYRETGSVRFREVPRLVATGDEWGLPPALNEIVVQGERRGHGGGCSIEVRVDGSLYTGGHADGVLVATPTGSTAYNLSEHGPLVHPLVSGMVLTEMCASDPMPSLVVDNESQITVTVDDAQRAFAVADGRERIQLDPPAQIRIGRANDPIWIAGPGVDFFEALGKLD